MKLANLLKQFDDVEKETNTQQQINNYLKRIKNMKQRGYKNDKKNVYEKCEAKLLQRYKSII
jgi:hypothetical protein